jgi:hypothetical protein
MLRTTPGIKMEVPAIASQRETVLLHTVVAVCGELTAGDCRNLISMPLMAV